MGPTFITHCDIAAYQSWTRRRVAPPYIRGIPTWVWQSALCRRRREVHGT